MFNLKSFNNALLDLNLSDSEFRMYCLILNTMSLKKINSLEMFNGFFMDKLNLKERQVQNLTKSLCDKGYIIKIKSATSMNRNGNIYQLPSDKNVTPYKENVEVQKIAPLNTQSEKQNTDSGAERGAKNCTPYNYNINKNISSIESIGPGSCTSNTDMTSLEEILSKEYKDWEEALRQTSSEKSRYTRLLNEFNELCDYFYRSKDINTFKEREDQLRNIIYQMSEMFKNGRISEEQMNTVVSLEEELNKIVAGKVKYASKVLKSKKGSQTLQNPPVDKLSTKHQKVSQIESKVPKTASESSEPIPTWQLKRWINELNDLDPISDLQIWTEKREAFIDEIKRRGNAGQLEEFNRSLK